MSTFWTSLRYAFSEAFSRSSQEKSTLTTASLLGSVSTETFTCPPTSKCDCVALSNQGTIEKRSPALHTLFSHYNERQAPLESARGHDASASLPTGKLTALENCMNTRKRNAQRPAFKCNRVAYTERWNPEAGDGTRTRDIFLGKEALYH